MLFNRHMSRLPAFNDMLHDVFNLLLFLQARDVKLRGEWFLPPTTLRQLVPLMLSESQCVVPSLRHDLPTQRVRFVVFLAHCAGLVAAQSSPRGALLKPSAAALSWLGAPMPQRTAILAQALFSDEPASAQLWSRLHLPGWRVIKAGLLHARPFRFGDVRHALLHLAQPQRTPSQNILSVLPIVIEPRIKDSDARTSTLLHAILTALCWFGAIRPATLALTRSAPALLRNAPVPVQPAASSDGAHLSLVLDHPAHHALIGLRLVESKPAGWSLLFDLARIMQLTGARPRTFTLDHVLVLRAYDAGLSINAALTLLERAVADALPRAVSLLLHRWRNEYEHLQLRSAIILQTDSPALLDQILEHRDIRRELHRLSPDTAELRSGKVDSLMRRLKRLGIAAHNHVVVNDPGLLTDGFRPADWALIYQALELNQHLTDIAPHLATPGAITPRALLQSVAARLEPAQVDAIRAAVQEDVNHSLTHFNESALLHKDDDATSRLIRERLEQAIPASAWVRLTYYAAGSAEVTLRDVQPRRIEWRGAVPYLIAWCNLRRDERTFRIDRIMALEDSPPGTSALPPPDPPHSPAAS